MTTSTAFHTSTLEEWPKSEGEPVELEFEDGNVSVAITPETCPLIAEMQFLS